MIIRITVIIPIVVVIVILLPITEIAIVIPIVMVIKYTVRGSKRVRFEVCGSVLVYDWCSVGASGIKVWAWGSGAFGISCVSGCGC